MFNRGWIFLGAVAVALMLPVTLRAQVLGNCVLCHTMHNSEQGSPVAYTLDPNGQRVVSEQPLENLLRTNCIGCHSHAGAETIVENEGVRVPIVLNLTEPTYPPDGSLTSTLAAGNYHWMISKGSAYGHNVGGIIDADLRFSPITAPGGEERAESCSDCHGSLATATSSCEGCHVPQHHAEGAGTVVGYDQGWYRFLGSVMQRDLTDEPPTEGVVGIEDPDWEQNPAADRHNVYQGGGGPYTSYLESGAISQKCVGCHGLFHSDTASGSTWIRHPVDVAIPDAGEFAALSLYNPLVPVARPNVSSGDADFSLINRDSDMVSCISCHRPHGSPYPAMLRWGYRAWPGIDEHTQQDAYNGCAVCHTSKD
jgi:hypothetical protein